MLSWGLKETTLVRSRVFGNYHLLLFLPKTLNRASQVAQWSRISLSVQETLTGSGDFPGSGRSPGGRKGNLLQYSHLENPKDRGAWRATVMGLQRVRHNWATEHTQVLNKVNKFILSPCFMSMRYTKISSCTSPLGALSLFYWQGDAPQVLNIQCPHATMFSLTQPSWYQSWKEWKLPFIEGFDVLGTIFYRHILSLIFDFTPAFSDYFFLGKNIC